MRPQLSLDLAFSGCRHARGFRVGGDVSSEVPDLLVVPFRAGNVRALPVSPHAPYGPHILKVLTGGVQMKGGCTEPANREDEFEADESQSAS